MSAILPRLPPPVIIAPMSLPDAVILTCLAVALSAGCALWVCLDHDVRRQQRERERFNRALGIYHDDDGLLRTFRFEVPDVKDVRLSARARGNGR